jgi:hypothetical protein
MLGHKARIFTARLVSLEGLVPPDHFYRQVEQRLNLHFVRDLVCHYYAPWGRPSIDPIVFFKLQLIAFFEGIRSERQLMETVIWPPKALLFPSAMRVGTCPPCSSATSFAMRTISSRVNVLGRFSCSCFMNLWRNTQFPEKSFSMSACVSTSIESARKMLLMARGLLEIRRAYPSFSLLAGSRLIRQPSPCLNPFKNKTFRAKIQDTKEDRPLKGRVLVLFGAF